MAVNMSDIYIADRTVFAAPTAAISPQVRVMFSGGREWLRGGRSWR